MAGRGPDKKPRKPGAGGWRPGAGRKPGSRSKRSEAVIVRAEASGLELPLPRLLRRMNDLQLDEKYRDQLAALAAPFCHPKFSAATLNMRVSDPRDMSDDELRAFVENAEAARNPVPIPYLHRVK